MTNLDLYQIGKVLNRAKSAAKEYRELSGKPLGITGEVAEFEASRLLGLQLSEARQPGYDATRVRGQRTDRIQIKGRRIPKGSKPGQRLGSIRFDNKWDYVVLVILDEDFEPAEIHEAKRAALCKALKKPGSKSRNERGALSVSKFKSIGRLLWSRDEGNAA